MMRKHELSVQKSVGVIYELPVQESGGKEERRKVKIISASNGLTQLKYKIVQ